MKVGERSRDKSHVACLMSDERHKTSAVRPRHESSIPFSSPCDAPMPQGIGQVPERRFCGKTVILAAGDFPSHPVPLAALFSASAIVCCDSAAAELVACGFSPDAIVGDLDSLPADLKERFADRLFPVAEQDDNDLAKAFRFTLGKGWRDIVILGATGKREDHTLGNISWLADFAPLADSVVMLTDNGLFQALQAPGGTIRVEPGDQISLFSFDPSVAVSAEGLKYPVDNLHLRRWWTATLNEAVSDTVSFHFASGTLLAYIAW